MDTLSYKTQSLRKEDVNRQWIVIDATDLHVGRLASRIVHRLRGKHKTNYTPHVDGGDAVIVINCEKVRFSGRKMNRKLYFTHSNYPGGYRLQTPIEILKKDPRRIIEHAVKGMLPHTRLGDDMFRHLFVYVGAEHPHVAQQPITVELDKI